MPMTTHCLHLTGLISCLAMPACILGGGASGSGVGGAGGDVMEVEGSDALRECAGDLTQAEIDDNLQITADYAQSLHEMVACGGLAVRLCQGVSSGIVDAILTSSTDATPDGWSYQGDGVYITQGPGVEMTTRFYAAEDFTFAAEGEVVPYDLFQVESYLVDPVISIDFSTGRTELVFAEVGPLVELLGLGVAPQSPVELTLADTQGLNRKLEALELDSTVVVNDPQGYSSIQYLTQSPRMPAKDLLLGVAMDFALVEASGLRADTEQDLVVDDWTIQFVGGNMLEGSSVYHVEGGSFDYFGEARFERSSYAETTVSCTRP